MRDFVAILTEYQLQIQHLIYAKTLSTERRAHYVDTFNHNEKFRQVDPGIKAYEAKHSNHQI
jgi:hypothetical protein